MEDARLRRDEGQQVRARRIHVCLRAGQNLQVNFEHAIGRCKQKARFPLHLGSTVVQSAFVLELATCRETHSLQPHDLYGKSSATRKAEMASTNTITKPVPEQRPTLSFSDESPIHTTPAGNLFLEPA